MLEKFRSISVKEKDEFLNEIERAAYNYEVEYGNEVRCVLFTLHRYLGLYDDEGMKGVFKSVAAFPGGIVCTTEVCGGMLAGVMAISLIYGPAELHKLECTLTGAPGYKPETALRHRENSDRAYEFISRFKKEFGSVECKDIQTKLFGRYWDLRNPDEYTFFLQRPHHDKCGEVAGKAARLAAEVILEPLERIPRFIPGPPPGC